MGEVAQTCGDDVALALMEAFPGTRFCVPKRFVETGMFAPLGREMSERFFAEFGGEMMYIPTSGTRPRPEDHAADVEALVDEGLSTREIAKQLGFSQAYVFKIRRAAGAPKIANKPDPRQLPLL